MEVTLEDGTELIATGRLDHGSEDPAWCDLEDVAITDTNGNPINLTDEQVAYVEDILFDHLTQE